MEVTEVVERGAVDTHFGKLYYFRDDANRKCFALFWANTNGGAVAMTPISCEDISWH